MQFSGQLRLQEDCGEEVPADPSLASSDKPSGNVLANLLSISHHPVHYHVLHRRMVVRCAGDRKWTFVA